MTSTVALEKTLFGSRMTPGQDAIQSTSGVLPARKRSSSICELLGSNKVEVKPRIAVSFYQGQNKIFC
jgi:hypothetical protein